MSHTRRVARRLALAIALLAVTAGPRAVAAQQAGVLPQTWYRFAGCWEGVSCHTVDMLVGELVGPSIPPQFDGFKAMLYQISSTYQPGAATPQSGIPFGVVTAQGSSFVFQGDDVFRATFCGISMGGSFPTTVRPCTNPTLSPFLEYGSPALEEQLLIALRVTPDWRPESFFVDVVRGTPGTPFDGTPDEETRRLFLPLVATVNVVPEPSTVALLVSGLAMLGAGAWRRRVRT